VTAELSTGCEKYIGRVYKNGTLMSTVTKNAGSNPSISTNNFQVSATDTILLQLVSQTPTGAGCGFYFGTTAFIRVGTPFSQTIVKTVYSPNTDSYTYNPVDNTTNAVNFRADPTS
jgi:hypothetical protein